MNKYICPKCNTGLEKRFFKETVIYYCPKCVRGYTESHLKAIREEIDMTLDLIEKEKELKV